MLRSLQSTEAPCFCPVDFLALSVFTTFSPRDNFAKFSRRFEINHVDAFQIGGLKQQIGLPNSEPLKTRVKGVYTHQGFTRNGRGHSCTHASAPQPHAPVFLRLLDGWRRWGRRWRWRRRRRCSQGGAHARRVQVHDNGCEVVGQIPKAFLALGHACLEECMHLRRKRARARTVPVSSPPTLVRRSQNHTLLFPC